MDVFTSPRESKPGLLVRLYYPWCFDVVFLVGPYLLFSAQPSLASQLNGFLGFLPLLMLRYCLDLWILQGLSREYEIRDDFLQIIGAC